jgi:phosphoglycolate phosphatase-like HAD superfamily hydrolase
MRPLRNYHSLIFDCDGVILDSNKLKTDGFFQVARPYGEAAAEALVTYHTQNGGMSRYRKFEWLFDSFLQRPASPDELEKMAEGFADYVKSRLLTCAITPGLADLKRACGNRPWSIVSGSDEAELRDIFDQRGLTALFDAGIYGSPASKHEIFERHFASGHFAQPAIYFGDSRLDHVVARDFDCDFMFVSGWSEFADWPEYLQTHDLQHIERLADMVK